MSSTAANKTCETIGPSFPHRELLARVFTDVVLDTVPVSARSLERGSGGQHHPDPVDELFWRQRLGDKLVAASLPGSLAGISLGTEPGDRENGDTSCGCM